MAINIKTVQPPADQGPHAEAADAIHTEVSAVTTSTKTGEILDEKHESSADPQHFAPAALIGVIRVGMSFKMPVAQYTMLELSVSRSIPYQTKPDPVEDEAEADAVFEVGKAWVEGKLNALIGEQQTEG